MGGAGGGRKRKKAMYSAFVLIIPPRLEDIQAASVPRLGFGRKGYQQAHWGASATFLPPPPPYHILSEGGQRDWERGEVGASSSNVWQCLVGFGTSGKQSLWT